MILNINIHQRCLEVVGMYTLEGLGMRCWEQSLWVAVLNLAHEDCTAATSFAVESLDSPCVVAIPSPTSFLRAENNFDHFLF